MSNWKCNSCGGEYSDAGGYTHVCPTEIIEHAEFDAAGKQTKPEKRTPRTDVRNENPRPGVYHNGERYVRRAPNPEERGQFIEVPAEPGIISEGKGRTQIGGGL